MNFLKLGFCRSVKYLIMVIDNRLSLDSLITSACQKLNKVRGIMTLLARQLSRDSLLKYVIS